MAWRGSIPPGCWNWKKCTFLEHTNTHLVQVYHVYYLACVLHGNNIIIVTLGPILGQRNIICWCWGQCYKWNLINLHKFIHSYCEVSNHNSATSSHRGNWGSAGIQLIALSWVCRYTCLPSVVFIMFMEVRYCQNFFVIIPSARPSQGGLSLTAGCHNALL